MRLNEIGDRPGATKPRKRRGRGIGSGLGKTSGKGTKGQKSRSGVAIKGFEGGQMPLHRRLPKRGFNNIFTKHFNEVNLGKVQSAIDAGRIDAKNPITVEALLAAGLIRRVHDGVRLLGTGEIKTTLAFEVTGASAGAIKAVEAKGGSVTLTPRPHASGKPVAIKPDKPKKPRGLKAKAAEAEAAKSAKAEKAKAKQAAEAEASAEPQTAEAVTDAPQEAKPAKAKKAEAAPAKTAKAEDKAKKPRAKPAKKE
ncbi:MAG: 50S ribosomal protein L15 [Alphaproteobacteria bacterium]|nr:50S ribosomal protein L15 [Alphaproteobacteria bacterium]